MEQEEREGKLRRGKVKSERKKKEWKRRQENVGKMKEGRRGKTVEGIEVKKEKETKI